MVPLTVDEFSLRLEEVRGEEDVAAEGGQEVVQLGGRGWGEDWEAAYWLKSELG